MVLLYVAYQPFQGRIILYLYATMMHGNASVVLKWHLLPLERSQCLAFVFLLIFFFFNKFFMKFFYYFSLELYFR